ncbi:MAG: DUF721 domain-containing protein [Spirochaetales bacterium]|nr:DUF721 domain-containing protein [Spirochaetales bacterium]
MEGSRAKKASEILARLFDGATFGQGSSFSRLHASWKSIAGQRLADHVKPVDVIRRTLVVVTDHAGWAQLLQMEQSRIIVRIAKEFPELDISSIACRVDPERFSAPPEVPAAQRAAPEPAQQENVSPPSDKQDFNAGETSVSLHCERKELPPELASIFSRLRHRRDG